jgi:hypothetical protein
MIFTSGLSRFFSSQSVCTTARAKFFGAAVEGATDIPATSPRLLPQQLAHFFFLSCFLT